MLTPLCVNQISAVWNVKFDSIQDIMQTNDAECPDPDHLFILPFHTTGESLLNVSVGFEF